MTPDAASRSRGRSIGAVVAGFGATALLSVGTDAVMHATGVFPPWGEPMANGLFVWAIVYRVVYTVLGGYVTATVAPGRPMSHVLALGAIGTLVATAGAVATWNAGPALGPRWYPVLVAVTGLPCVWAGGTLCVRRQQVT